MRLEKLQMPRASLVKEATSTILIALAGPPNVGKSTIFNALTGLRQHVGNWPGKTVERKEGIVEFEGRRFDLVDLPGTYSLTAHTIEEQIARDFLLRERPAGVIVVVNAASMERGLYLVSELLLLELPIVVALNMMDVAAEQGLEIEPDVLQAALGVPVVPVCAVEKRGLNTLLKVVLDVVEGRVVMHPRLPQVRADHQLLFNKVYEVLSERFTGRYPLVWLTTKLLEADPIVTRLVRDQLPVERFKEIEGVLAQHDDAYWAVVSGRYDWVGRMIRAAIRKPPRASIGWTETLDRWLTHPIWGVVALGVILGVVFGVTNFLGSPLQKLLEKVIVGGGIDLLSKILPLPSPGWGRLLTEGVLPGVGTVVSFVPILLIFFLLLALLEDIGYLGRAAFVMDRFMHVFGLHGRSFLPLMLGFGCNVPAVMATRVVESGRSRLLTILLTPFVPCSARLAIISVLGSAFFGSWATIVGISVIGLGLVLLVLCGFGLNLLARGERTALIMELPLYHRPNFNTVLTTVGYQLGAFLRKAATVIVLASVGVWWLAQFPTGEIQSSYLARIGQAIEPAFQVVGFDWRMVVSLLTSVIAKENAIGTLAILLGCSDQNFSEVVRQVYSPASGLSFLVVITLFVPCVPTLVTIWKESASWKWVAASVVITGTISLVLGAVVFNVAKLFL